MAIREPSPAGTSILQRALVNLRHAWQSLSQAHTRVARYREDLPDRDRDKLRHQIRECLEARGGEVSARARAAALGYAYLNLSPVGRQRFLSVLAHDFGVESERLRREIEVARSGREISAESAERIRAAVTPRYVRLLTQFNSLSSGVKFLVDLRADTIRFAGSDPSLGALERDLQRLLDSWFDVGFLDLERITWDSPASLLERLIAYEAVHEIGSWDDLKNRLGEDRRCYAFFHPRMPDEPLVFVEVALVDDASASIQALLDTGTTTENANSATTAVFYSISSTQEGLRGINLGNFLIKRVVDRLTADLPRLGHFVTLSPIPGFGPFLDQQRVRGLPMTAAERSRIEALLGTDPNAVGRWLATERWWDQSERTEAIKTPLMRLCAQYLLHEKNGARVDDLVANFHLNNGARIDRINWMADTSEKGMKQSAGMMANYRYELGEIERNHESYRTTGSVMAAREVLALAALPEEEGRSTPS
jgi:malonyl-CoA decarboxylase